MNGSTIANYSVYKKLDHIILIDAPFVEREQRIIERNDQLIKKNNLVERDKVFSTALKRAKKTGKLIERNIKNTGTLKELQIIADSIYETDIKIENKSKEKSMKEKYGGYKIMPVKFKQNSVINNERKKDGQSK